MNQLKTVAILGLLSGLLITVSYWIFGGNGGIIIGLGLAAVMNFGSWYFSDKIALAAYRAQPLTPEQAPDLYQMVKRLCDRAGMPMPKLFVVPSPNANAFATGRDPEHAAVAVTEGIVNLLSSEELEAVIAHELSHVRNRDTLTQAVAATIAGAIAFLAQMAQNFFFFFGMGRRDEDGPNPFAILVVALVAPIAAMLLQMWISRTREFEADAGSAQLTGNPRALASALQRLEANARQIPMQGNHAFEPLLIMHPFKGDFMGNLFATHPSTEARIQNLLNLEKNLIDQSLQQSATNS